MKTIKRIKETWKFKYLIYNLVARDLKVRYKGSTLGFLWSLLNPILMLAVYTVAFKYVLKLQIPNFHIYLFSALLPWNFLNSTLSMGVVSITENGNLVKKVYFPREILPLSIVLVNLFHFFLMFLVLIPALFLFHVIPGFSFFFLFIIIFFQFLFVLGLTLIVSAYNVYFKDVRHFLEVFLQLWFWGTPIIWSLEHLPQKLRHLANLNPFTPFVTAYRDIILNNRLPDITVIALIIAAGIVFFFLGILIFNRKQRRFAEEI